MNRLGLPPGTSPDALKPAWRRAVSVLHPDRNGPQADRELAEVNAAFQRLEAFVRQHGRLPGHRETTRRSRPPSRRRSPSWLVGALVLGAAVVVLWPHPTPVQSPDPVREQRTVEPLPPLALAPAPRPEPLGIPRDHLRVGLDPEAVERLAGPPLFRSAERWEYGPSEVRFTHGKVSGWYSSALRPLPVGDTPSFPPAEHP